MNSSYDKNFYKNFTRDARELNNITIKREIKDVHRKIQLMRELKTNSFWNPNGPKRKLTALLRR